MKLPTEPTVVVLASGRGERFFASGGCTHKLQALLAGKPVLEHTLDAVRASGIPWHLEGGDHAGMGDAIAAAVRATPHSTGWLVLPGDLPLIRSSTILAIAAALKNQAVVVPVFEGQRGHPVGFSYECREALLLLRGNQGAVSVVRGHAAMEVEVSDVGIVSDIDTVLDLMRAHELLAARGP